jgi:hypothetical protein
MEAEAPQPDPEISPTETASEFYTQVLNISTQYPQLRKEITLEGTRVDIKINGVDLGRMLNRIYVLADAAGGIRTDFSLKRHYFPFWNPKTTVRFNVEFGDS